MKRLSNNQVRIVEQVAEEVRNYMVGKLKNEINRIPEGSDFSGTCIEASEMIVEKLKEKGIDSKTVEGYCIYDDEDYGTDRGYDEHTWVESIIDGDFYYIDVVADQFEFGIYEEIPPIIISKQLPYYIQYNEPSV
jgi:hypothetical protein